MLDRKVRYVLVVACLLTAISLLPASVVADQTRPFSCDIVARRPARTFYPGEPIQLTVTVQGRRDVAVYTVTDYRGRKRVGGRLRAGRGQPVLFEIRRRLPTGIYFLKLDFRFGPVVEDAFCIIPRPDENVGARRLWGVHWRPRSDAEWAALAQMGVRHVRAEITWPDTEQVAGEYDFGMADMYARGAREFGLQLTILSGYTPRLYSMPPVDGEGRVASAWHTWAPADTIEWARFTDALASRLLDQTVPPVTLSQPANAQEAERPLVIGWEVWSEADQNFYYGTWERYLDMLRIAYCTIKGHAPQLPVVYGSCGHWTEMSLTVQAGCEDYFDLLAYHPGGPDPDWGLEDWMVNMPQVLVRCGSPRESAYTETYFAPDDPSLEPSFQLRLYATLKAWRQRFYIRSGCLRRLIGRPDTDYHALLWQRDDRLIPRPGYVGFAVARWLLEDAYYVGPLELRENARLELFLKHGEPLVVGWADSEQRIPMRLLRRAQLINAMGHIRQIQRASFQVPVGPEAIALWGVDYDYVRLAARQAMERVLSTELGFYSDHNSAYIDPLEQDTERWISPSFGAEVRRAVRVACRESREGPCRGPAAFYAAQRVVGAGMVQAARRCQADDAGLTTGARNTIWRLAQYLEDLGMIADGLGDRWPEMSNVSEQDISSTRCEADGLRRQVRLTYSGAECPFAERLVDRALEQLGWTEESGGRRGGAWWAATMQLRAAEVVAEVEEPVLRRVFVAANFPTAEQFTKATLVRPWAQHRVEARVYNFLDGPVAGRLRLEQPETWVGPEPSAAFAVPARGVSELFALPFGVPEEPRPWVTKAAWRPWDDLLVDLPEPLSPNSDLWVCGETDGGPTIPDMRYRVCVGSYPAQAQAVRIAAKWQASLEGGE